MHYENADHREAPTTDGEVKVRVRYPKFKTGKYSITFAKNNPIYSKFHLGQTIHNNHFVTVKMYSKTQF